MDPKSPQLTPSGRGLRRGAYLVLAGLFFLLGAVGAVLPGLPTTPFLLLTSYFLVRSSPRLNALLLRSRFFGPLLRDWQERRGVRRAVKYQAVSLIAVFAGISLLLADMPGEARLATLALALVGITVVVRLPVVAEESRATAS